MPNTPEVTWVGPGWYKLLTFAGGNQKVVQVSQNKAAQLPDCFWCATYLDCIAQFSERQQVKSKREVY